MKRKILFFCTCILAVGNLLVQSQGPPMWSLGGNSVTGSTSFIGTTNATDLIIKTNGQERVIIKGTTGGFRVKSLEGTGSAVVATNSIGELFRINYPNNANYFLNGAGYFTAIPTPPLSGWSTTASLILSDPGKKVGIGTNSPTEQLEVVGNAKINGELFVDSIRVKSIQVGDSSLHILGYPSPGLNGNAIYSTPQSILLPPHDGGRLNINCRNNSPNTILNAFSGNVGIGTLIPKAKLDVTGNVKISGKVGIGTTCLISSLPYDLTVEGTIGARKVIVESVGWCDFVFEDNYHLMTYQALRDYIKSNRHLPHIPSEAEIIKNGIDISDVLKGHTQTIEEIVLYILDLESQNGEMKNELKEMKNELNTMKDEIKLLKEK